VEAFLSFTIKGKEYNRKEMRSGSPLPIYQSEKGLGMRVARPTDEIQVLVRTVRFDVRFRLRHGQAWPSAQLLIMLLMQLLRLFKI
jgi:hypothetical protein